MTKEQFEKAIAIDTELTEIEALLPVLKNKRPPKYERINVDLSAIDEKYRDDIMEALHARKLVLEHQFSLI